MKGSAPLRRHFDNAIETGDRIFTSSIVAFELFFGAHKSMRPGSNREAAAAVLARLAEVVAFDEVDAEYAGRIRAELKETGLPIGPYDVLMAGQAMNRSMTLVTANTREFSRVKGLALQDWSLPAV